MAIKTFRVASTTTNNSGDLIDGVDQTAATRTDGWTVAKIASTNASDYDAATKQASGTFAAASGKPSALITGTTCNAFGTTAALNGAFAATAWTFTFAVRATLVSAQVGRMKMRVYRSVNADGTGATELTSGAQTGTTSALLSTTADVTSVVTWSPGTVINLANEYLFFVLAWEITTAGGSNSADVQIRTGQSAAGSRLVTPDFVPGQNVAIGRRAAATTVRGLTITPTSFPVGKARLFSVDIVPTGGLQGVGDVAASTRVAQSFLAWPGGGTLTDLQLRLSKFGSPTDNLIVEVQTDSGGSPSGTVLASQSVPASGFSSSQTWSSPVGMPVTLGGGSTFWIVLRRSGALDPSNMVFWQVGTGDPYPDGVKKLWNGSVWSAAQPDATFRATGTIVTVVRGVTVAAQFPSTPVLDDFNRADGALGSNWTAARASPYVLPSVSSNRVTSDPSIPTAACWVTPYGPYSEVYATVPTVVTGTYHLIARAGNLGGASFYGYTLDISVSTPDLWYLSWFNGASTGTIDVHGQDIVDGCQIALKVEGSTVSGLYKAPGGSWVTVGSGTDTNFPNAGYIGLGFDNPSMVLDDFGGGGTAVAGSSVAIGKVGAAAVVSNAAVLQTRAQASFTGLTAATSWTTANCTVGSTLWCYVYWDSATATCSVADPNNGAWVPIGSPQAGAGAIAGYRTQMFACFNNVSAAKPTVTATFSTSRADTGICLVELSAGRTIIESSNYATSAVANPTQSLTPNTVGDTMIGYCFAESSAPTSAGTGFTLYESATMNGNPTAVKVGVTAGSSNTATWNGTTQQTILGMAIVGNPAAAGGTSVVRGVNFSVPLATLTDDFASALDKTTKWSNSSAATVWDASGQAKLPCVLTPYTQLATSQSQPGYDLTGSSLIAKVTPPATGNGGRETVMTVLQGTGVLDTLTMFVSGTTLYARRVVAGVTSGEFTATYNATTHAWWRIRESAGTVYFDYSSDGATWLNHYSVATPAAITRCWVRFSCGYQGTESASDGFVDNVNVPPAGVSLPIGRRASATTVYGATLAATGAAPVTIGRRAAATVVKGVTLGATGAAPVVIGRKASATAVRGVTLAAAGAAPVPIGRVGTPAIPVTSGLAAWYDADDSASFSYSSGAVVSQWNDKSAGARHLAQATVGLQPARSGSRVGRPTVVFNGGYLIYNGNTGLDCSAVTAFVVVAESTEVVNAGFFAAHLGGSSNDYDSGSAFCMESSDASYNLGAARAITGTVPYPGQALFAGANPSPWGICEAVFRPDGSLDVYRDGVVGSVSNPRLTTFGVATGGFLVGGRYVTGLAAGYRLLGEIGEIVVFNRVLTTTERQQVESYLGGKWVTGTGAGTVVRGVTLATPVAQSVPIGRRAAATTVRGVTLAPTGSAGLAIGRVPVAPFSDDFNRGSLGANWTQVTITGSVNTLPSITSNELVGRFAGAKWTVGNSFTDLRVRAAYRYANPAFGNPWIGVMNANNEGYFADLENGFIFVDKCPADGNWINLGSYTSFSTYTSGGEWALEVTSGGVLTILYRDAGVTAWTTVMTRTDATLVGPWRGFLGLNDGTIGQSRLDDFVVEPLVAGGTVVRGVTLAPTGVAPVPIGRRATATAVRGVTLAAAGAAVVTIGKVGVGTAVRGVTLGAAPVLLPIGSRAAAAAARGVTLGVAGAAPVVIGRRVAVTSVKGVTLAPGPVSVTIGRRAAATAVRGVTLATAGGASFSRSASDTGLSFGDSVVRKKLAARAVSDAGTTMAESVSFRKKTAARAVTDTGTTVGMSVRKWVTHTVTQAGLTFGESLLMHKFVHKTASDTGTAFSDSVSTRRKSASRGVSTAGTTFSEVATRRIVVSRAASTAGATFSESITFRRKVATRAASTVGTAFSESAARRIVVARSTSTAGTTFSDSVTRKKVAARSTTTPGIATVSDSVTFRRKLAARAPSDRATTFTDLAVKYVPGSRSAIDLGLTFGDSVTRRKVVARMLADVAVAEVLFSASDNFNRANGALGVNWTGWTSGAALVGSNKARGA